LTLQGYTVTVDEHPPVLLISASPASLSIAQGQSGQTTLTFSPSGGYTATLSLNCLSLPANARCVFSQGGTSISSVTLSGNNQPATVDLTLQTDVPEVVARTRGGGSGATWLAMVLWWPGCFLGLAALCHGRRLRRSLSQRYLAALLLVVSGAIAAGLTGCAHEAARSLTPLGTSTIEVVATPSSGSAQTLTITVTITK